jgi:hypothetical protein
MFTGSRPELASPCWFATTRTPPLDAGASLPAGASVPAVSVPDAAVSPLLSSSSPQAAMIAPMKGTDKPMMVPRLTKLRRLMRP